MSAKNDKEAKKGGVYKRHSDSTRRSCRDLYRYVYEAGIFHPCHRLQQLFPFPSCKNMPPMLAGMIMATLLVAVVGTGSGLALGISSILCQDIFKVYIKKDASDKAMLTATRVAIAAVLGLAVIFTTGNLGSLILEWSFMSMGSARGSDFRASLRCTLFCGARRQKVCGFSNGCRSAFCVYRQADSSPGH